ncbi:Hypothetical_protein [Hexamita inflata]|uniref:Hypothetical_protein n=1 Tax=Hexamita inflata TaxID=28002 RepID=A0ABP1GGP7_9EUKA
MKFLGLLALYNVCIRVKDELSRNIKHQERLISSKPINFAFQWVSTTQQNFVDNVWWFLLLCQRRPINQSQGQENEFYFGKSRYIYHKRQSSAANVRAEVALLKYQLCLV